jgi:hypothetical protein
MLEFAGEPTSANTGQHGLSGFESHLPSFERARRAFYSGLRGYHPSFDQSSNVVEAIQALSRCGAELSDDESTGLGCHLGSHQ